MKQEQGRLQGLQTALEDERRMWTEQQARERANMEKSRVGIVVKNIAHPSLLLYRSMCYTLSN